MILFSSYLFPCLITQSHLVYVAHHTTAVQCDVHCIVDYVRSSKYVSGIQFNIVINSSLPALSCLICMEYVWYARTIWCGYVRLGWREAQCASAIPVQGFAVWYERTYHTHLPGSHRSRSDIVDMRRNPDILLRVCLSWIFCPPLFCTRICGSSWRICRVSRRDQSSVHAQSLSLLPNTTWDRS